MMCVRPNLIGCNHWGYYDTKKSEWNGMVASLLLNESEFAIGSSVFTSSRQSAVDFNVYSIAWKFKAFYRTPNFNHNRLACLHPFDGILWLVILFAIPSFALVLMIMTFSYKILKTQDPTEEDNGVEPEETLHNRFSVPDCIYLPINLICCKGVDQIPKTFSVRFALLVGSFAGLVLNVAYSGTLISFLSVALGSLKRFEQLLETSFIFDTKAIIEFAMLKVRNWLAQTIAS